MVRQVKLLLATISFHIEWRFNIQLLNMWFPGNEPREARDDGTGTWISVTLVRDWGGVSVPAGGRSVSLPFKSSSL